MTTIVISYDEELGTASVVNAESCEYSTFQWNKNYEIEDESPNTDGEDFNDNARWLIKTLLCILKLEKEDELCHCDWSADYDRFPKTGKYRFNASIEKVKGEQ